MTTPNKITIARILMIPLFVMMAIYYGRSVVAGVPVEWQRWLATALFLVAAASDGIDGYIARRYNQRSRLGEILDPIADKGLLLAGIITLSVSNWRFEFPVWFPVLVIARVVIVVAGAITLQMLNGSVRVKPSWTGKISTALQMVAVACIMLQLDLFRVTVWKIDLHFLDIPVWLAGIFTAVSGFGYVKVDLPNRRAEKIELEHVARDRDHLQRGRDLAGPTRLDPHRTIQHVQRDRTRHDDDIARDDEQGKPHGKLETPVAQAERDDAREEQTFVGDWVEDFAKTAALIVAARDVAVDAVARRGDEKDGGREPALPFHRSARDHAATVVNRHHHEKRDHQDPGNGDFVGRGH